MVFSMCKMLEGGVMILKGLIGDSGSTDSKLVMLIVVEVTDPTLILLKQTQGCILCILESQID